MTGFSDALWDDSDPTYAPCIDRKKDGRAFWRCPRRYKAAGYTLGQVPLPADPVAAAALCRALTREMVQWWEGQSRRPDETVGWLIGRYRTDEFSEYQGVKPNTREDYRQSLAYWQYAIGTKLISRMGFEEIKSLELGMKAQGRSDAFIHRKFTMLRSVMKHGKLIEAQGADKVHAILAAIRFRTSPARTIYPTREQVYAVVDAARKHGSRAFAVGIELQYELTLRAVDVRGQWLDAEANATGLIRNGRRWQDGLTWAMFDRDWWSFEKVISKTLRSMPEPVMFSLRDLPEIRSELLSLSTDRIGPVIVSERTGLPYTRDGWAQAWARYRKTAGVPMEVQMRDTRAGAISEADAMGATEIQQSQAAQHSKTETTARYRRTRNKHVADVIQLRRGGKP